MSHVSIKNTPMGSALTSLLTDAEIVPGSEPSYQLCKTIYLYHPLGAKMVDGPINIAQSQMRVIAIPAGPEERLKVAFEEEWERLNATNLIFNTMVLSRVYGIASLVVGAKDKQPLEVISPFDYSKLDIYFNILDPLNTAGSLVLNQDPNSPNFQKVSGISVAGVPYHPSRACVVLHGEPIYISYTVSAFGFVGRSVFQRSLYPLKTFISTMRTDDMVTRKAGVIVASMKQVGSAVDAIMAKFARWKRDLLKEAETDNVISIGIDEKVESIDLQNTDTAMKQARTNVLENIAVGADMPAKMLNSETFAEGFGEGTEDAKMVARFIELVRQEMKPLYTYMDEITMYRAWSPEFYAAIQAEFPDQYPADMKYETAFYQWKNSFTATWPSLLIEPESKQVEVEKVKFEAIIKFVEVIISQIDPENKSKVIQWAADNLNANKMLFTAPLILDYEALAQYQPPAEAQGGDSEENEESKPLRVAA